VTAEGRSQIAEVKSIGMTDLATHYLDEIRRQLRGHKLERLRGVSEAVASGTRDFRVTGWRSGSRTPKS
jgi:hypothetical protein